MKIMTFNIWGDYFGNPCDERSKGIEHAFREYDPDIFGVQEANDGWYNDDLFDRLSDEYQIIKACEGNYTPLFYKKDAFELLECGWEHYTDTPDPSKTVTSAVLREKASGKKIAVLNTHFWWMSRGEEDNALRVSNAKQLLARMDFLKSKYNCPVFAFGDLNCKMGSDPIELLRKGGVVSAVELAEEYSKKSSHHGDPQKGEDGLHHGKPTEYDLSMSIDHIVSYVGTPIIKQAIVEDKIVLDASDHSPVYIEIKI